MHTYADRCTHIHSRCMSMNMVLVEESMSFGSSQKGSSPFPKAGSHWGSFLALRGVVCYFVLTEEWSKTFSSLKVPVYIPKEKSPGQSHIILDNYPMGGKETWHVIALGWSLWRKRGWGSGAPRAHRPVCTPQTWGRAVDWQQGWVYHDGYWDNVPADVHYPWPCEGYR